MPWSYSIDPLQKMVFSRQTGEVGAQEIIAHSRALQSDPQFDPTYAQLYDLSEARSLNFSTENLRAFANKTIFAKGTRRAFLVKSDVAFGLARMFGSYREINGDNGISVFRSRSEALAWLQVHDREPTQVKSSESRTSAD